MIIHLMFRLCKWNLLWNRHFLSVDLMNNPLTVNLFVLNILCTRCTRSLHPHCTQKYMNTKGTGCTCTRCTRGSGIPADEQVFYDKFLCDKFYLPSARAYIWQVFIWQVLFTGVNLSKKGVYRHHSNRGDFRLRMREKRKRAWVHVSAG